MIILTTRTAPPSAQVVSTRAHAEAYIASICFKTGPPCLVGVELEWTVHHADDPRRPLEYDQLVAALGAHAPAELRGPQLPLPNGSMLTVEPGGQVEVSTAPQPELSTLISVASADIAYVVELLRRSGLVLGTRGTDPFRPRKRLLDTPRYRAMERAFEPIGPHGRTMMCSTAGLQVCLDAGEPHRVPVRWAAVHALGPVLTAAFANSPELDGARTGWASTRMRAVAGTDPVRTSPAPVGADPARLWARHALDAPLVCLRRPGEDWSPPPGVTLGDWVDGAIAPPPTTDDIDYHISTLFPPVRPRGYLEVRYLDAQPTGEWVVPLVLLTALFHQESTVDAVLDVTVDAADRWEAAARYGLADPVLALVAERVFELGARAIPALGLPAELASLVIESLEHVRAGDPA
ncbi:ergothioneine biosynthesis glutamate--cysteine ligase EgtA [Allokutzneria sp. A3M-2-11 16]|uniref:ergothioneine biosynthesis glutamate--cysteine ligase EgtA n=1 Tax=Allokutzneria sp. A3M-2-11 16 TaxID=2962043 RepID=UPI0035A96846